MPILNPVKNPHKHMWAKACDAPVEPRSKRRWNPKCINISVVSVTDGVVVQGVELLLFPIEKSQIRLLGHLV